MAGYNSNVRGNELDTSVVLGGTNPVEFAMGLMNRAFQEQQATQNRKLQYARMQQERAMESQRLANESEYYTQQHEERDFNRALQLVQAGVKPQDAFAAAPRTPGNRLPVLDAIYKQGQEAKKAAEEEKTAAWNRGNFSTELPGLVAMDDALARQRIPEIALRLQRPERDILAALEAAEALDRQKRADFEAEQSRKDARARTSTSGAQRTPIDEANDELKLRKQWSQEVRPVLEAVGQAHSAITVSAKPPVSGTEQIIRDQALVNAYARMLQSVGVLTDRDIDRAAGRIPGVIGSAQQFFALATEGSTLDEGRRKEILSNLRTLSRFSEKRARDTEGFLAKNAKKRGLNPADIFAEGLLDVPDVAPPAAEEPAMMGPPAPVPSESEYRVNRVRARQFLGREPTDAEIRDLMRMRMGGQ